MAVDSTPLELGTADEQAWFGGEPPRRAHRPRLLLLAFGLCLLLLGAIATSGAPPGVNAALPHSLRTVIGEGCGGG
jgi:hypothetical protein